MRREQEGKERAKEIGRKEKKEEEDKIKWRVVIWNKEKFGKKINREI